MGVMNNTLQNVSGDNPLYTAKSPPVTTGLSSLSAKAARSCQLHLPDLQVLYSTLLPSLFHKIY